MTSSSLAGMHIQFRTLMFHSRIEEQLQEHLYIKKSTTSLSAAIGTLDSSLGPHPESDLSIDLYFDSTPIATIDGFDRWFSFNHFNKSVILLSAAIGASISPLGPHTEEI
jgi:hypothetical protein